MRGATFTELLELTSAAISTHTPHAGRDDLHRPGTHHQLGFLLPRPMRGATSMRRSGDGIRRISTHTPHAGRDQRLGGVRRGLGDFYSHAPCGARHIRIRSVAPILNFYSHAPCGARPLNSAMMICSAPISTHTPHAGRDRLNRYIDEQTEIFLLTRPMRGATSSGGIIYDRNKFLLTRPMRGATDNVILLHRIPEISTHTPHAGRDRGCDVVCCFDLHFYSHAPCGARPGARLYRREL